MGSTTAALLDVRRTAAMLVRSMFNEMEGNIIGINMHGNRTGSMVKKKADDDIIDIDGKLITGIGD